jgi:hypothetical protein
VVLNGSNSEWKTINARVPQGSILGPLLFILFINDIVTNIKASIKLFADDTGLYVTADIINRDLEKIHQWSVNWLVKFNPQKTETMVISRKLIKPLQPPLEMNSQILQQGTHHKHLGLFFSNNGLWHDHIDYIVKKAYTRLSMLRKVRFKLNRFTLEKMYLSFIRPILEYGDVVWDTQIHYLINIIENVQSEAARIVTGGTQLTSIQKLCEKRDGKNLWKKGKNIN